MAYLDTEDGAKIFYKDWGHGRPIVFLHGWPLTADMWDNQMMVFGQAGMRVVAPDRRGFGRSSQHWEHNTNERFADDLAALIDHLGLENIVLVGHSMAGGDICKYVASRGCAKLSRIVMLGTVPPLMLQTAHNPDGIPMSIFDEMRDGVMTMRSGFMQATAKQFFGFNRLTHKTDQGLLDSFWLQAMMAGVKPTYDCIKQFAEVDFTADLKKFSVPTLFIHGDDDQMVPLKTASAPAAKLVPGAQLKIYPGGSHAISLTEATKFNQDLMNFIG
jgi:non-heme chloroperoxidase